MKSYLLALTLCLVSTSIFAQYDEDEELKKNQIGLGMFKYNFQLPNLQQQSMESPFIRARFNTFTEIQRISAWPNIYITRIINKKFGVRVDLNGRSLSDSVFGAGGLGGPSIVKYRLVELIPNIQYYFKQDVNGLGYAYAGIGYINESQRINNLILNVETVSNSIGLPWQAGVGYTARFFKGLSATAQLGFYNRSLKNNVTNQSLNTKFFQPLSRLSVDYHF